MQLPSRVQVTEVGPRDGLQSEPAFIPTERKVALIEALAAAGVPRIEATSFVHPRAVPQMADAEAVLASIRRRPGTRYTALVPNARGAERALAARADELNVVVSSTEAMSQANVRMSVAESIAACAAVVRLAEAAHVPVACAVTTCFGCPYEGPVAPQRVLDVVARLVDAGVAEITLADTIGVANPRQVEQLVQAVQARWPQLPLGLHFHDTRGLGLANVLAGLQNGVTRYDASVAGVGACPFAPGATGNITTEDLVYLLHELDITTGIDLAALLDAARLMREVVGHEVPSRLLRAGPRPVVPAQP
ncbi:MAG: hydroxymethylglutaryl-CoA lyase [Chloroflexi bacterium]|nr:hydroxymethylglutaryl-CoA lyase [Chloroflexota bacterium]